MSKPSPTQDEVHNQLERIRQWYIERGNRRVKVLDFLESLIEFALDRQGRRVRDVIRETYKDASKPNDGALRKMQRSMGETLRQYYEKQGVPEELLIEVPSVTTFDDWDIYVPTFGWLDTDIKRSDFETQSRATQGVPHGQPRTRVLEQEGKIRYLDALINDLQQRARCYYPVRAKGRKDAGSLSFLPLSIQALARRAGQNRRVDEIDPPQDAILALKELKQAVVLGSPGAGKSTLLCRLALNLAEEARSNSNAPLPVFARLGKWIGGESIDQFLTTASKGSSSAGIELDEPGRCAIVLDELNQIPVAQWRDKSDQIRALVRRLPDRTPIYVSCRLHDYGEVLDLSLTTLTLEPLSPPEVRAALCQWETTFGGSPEDVKRIFWQLAGSSELEAALETWTASGGEEDNFWLPGSLQEAAQRLSWQQLLLWKQRVQDPRSLLKLASNPFMFAMFYCVAKCEGGTRRAGSLPRNRGRLFREFIDTLLDQEGLVALDGETGSKNRTDVGERLLAGLKRIAWHMQSGQIDAGLDKKETAGILSTISSSQAVELMSGDQGLLKKAVDTSLLEAGEFVSFRHQLFQEYFVAQSLERQIEETTAAELWPPDRWWEPSGWEEAYVMFAGSRRSGSIPVVRWSADAQPEVTAACVADSEIRDPDELFSELRAAWIPRLTNIEGDPQPEARAAVGRALGRLRLSDGRPLDDRRGVALTTDGVPDIAWARIAGGEFVYQHEKMPLDTFYLARYPVTNIQFQAFCDAEDGYHNPHWWRSLYEAGCEHQPGKWLESNHPRETVSWCEATAFCAWISSRLGYSIRLPSEWEWERAARGTRGSEYPWGDYEVGFSNIGRMIARGRTSPVGIFDHGATPEAVQDLAGNLWEWCSNQFQRPERMGRSGAHLRVVRGGCWLSDPAAARASFRYFFAPTARLSIVGFRVASSSVPHGVRTTSGYC